MESDVAQVERALLALAPEERAAVIEQGLLSLDEAEAVDPADVEAAWRAEIGRRMDEYARGDAELVDMDQHLAQLRAR